MIPEEAKRLFITKYSNFGTEKFYKFLLNYGITRIVNHSEMKGISPEIELLDYYDKFLILYRREGDELYLEIAKLFRKAAHKLYKILLKKDLIEKSSKFLNIVE